MALLDFIILSLAVWRLSSLLIDEDGPYKICERLRQFLQRNISAELFSCIWCFSIWLGVAATIAYYTIPVYTTWICLPFALSALAITMDKING